MRIRDYETGKELSDVAISLTADEAADMIAYLQRLVKNPGIVRVHMSEVQRLRIDKEITFALDERAVTATHHGMMPTKYAVGL